MKIVLAAVISLDGKITRWNEAGANSWNSEEDQAFFHELVEKSEVIIMGSATYETIKSGMLNREGRLRVVLTRDPEKYASVAILGQLEFSAETPKELVARLESIGHKQALLAGGERIYQTFLQDKLVSDVWLTIEPKIFGIGKSFSGAQELDLNLELKSFEKLNEQGTILAKYEVL